MTNPKIEVDIADILKDLQTGQKELLKEISSFKEQTFKEISEIKGEIKALNVKVDQLEKRIGNVEFSSRGILIGIGVVILGGLAMLFGFGKV